MRTTSFWLVLALAAACSKDYVFQSICADEAPLFSMQHYLDKKFGNTPEAKIQAMAADGWELVSVGPANGCSQYITFRKGRREVEREAEREAELEIVRQVKEKEAQESP